MFAGQAGDLLPQTLALRVPAAGAARRPALAPFTARPLDGSGLLRLAARHWRQAAASIGAARRCPRSPLACGNRAEICRPKDFCHRKKRIPAPLQRELTYSPARRRLTVLSAAP